MKTDAVSPARVVAALVLPLVAALALGGSAGLRVGPTDTSAIVIADGKYPEDGNNPENQGRN
ncbi:hypothetical protein [Phytohabitans rumicis]|uniref:Uncharacterized protein n=1 Tax=Phytohabitans rumicis TaxID=1076125 RepID=A0A6V8LG38_9ACTN|nr:hypothetical protein [Phytohabitans rumicis]GFJ93027.1 hypothetical protein Prum_066690 [Phytohabitans rumicis]